MAVVWDPTLEQALADGRTLTWRTEPLLRWGTVVGAAVAVVVALFGWWWSATDASPLAAEQLSDGEVILVGGAWFALILAGSAVWAWCRQVTVAPEGLVVRRVVSVTTMAWPSIGAVETDGGSVLVSTAEGTFLVPLGQWGPASIAGAGAATLAPAAAIEVAWWRRRGQAWSPPPLDAWVPTYDRHGRVALRRSLGAMTATYSRWFGGYVGAFGVAAVRNSEEPIVAGSFLLIAIGIPVAVVATAWLRTGVVIDGDDVVVRRFWHADRWCRRDIVGISVTAGREWLATAPRHHLVLVLRDGRGILLPAPTTSTASALTHDPAFERKRRWLVEHLVGPNVDPAQRAAFAAAAPMPRPPASPSSRPPLAPPYDPAAWSGPGPFGA